MSQPADVLSGAYQALIARKLGTLGDPLHLYSTTTLTVPTGVVRAYVRIKGPGGSGAVIKNDTQGAASGGGGGGHAEGWLVVVPGESMVCTVPAGAAGVTAEGAGTGGSTASIAVASKTISATGGCAGSISLTNAVATANGTAGVGSNGDINTSGGLPGQCTCVTSKWMCSGGASPGNAFGNGAQSGTVGTGNGNSGGAGMYAASGACTGASASGGGGWRGASGAVTGIVPTAGGGPFSASTAASTANVSGLTNALLGAHPVFALSIPFGASGSGSAAGTAATYLAANGNGGGGGAIYTPTSGASAGDGGFGAGGGAINANGNALAMRAGRGGPYGGGGSCNHQNGSTPGILQGGDGGIAAGGGAVSSIATGAAGNTSGAGGPAEVVIQWLWP